MTSDVYRQGDFVVVVERTADVATVYWRGVSDQRFPAQFLSPLIDELSVLLKNVSVTIDLRGLEYMNSATVPILVHWVKRFDANGRPVRVVFLDVDWQRTQGSCMTAIARTLKNVQIERVPVTP